MRAINVLLSLVVSVILGLIVLELGFRAMGLGPQSTINQFDPVTGWSKTPNAKGERKTREFDVHYDINALGLRDDLSMTSPAKPAGTFRVLMLGDSFVLGYTVEQRDLFVDLLEKWWQAEGRKVDVINAGTEGWSTDQEVAWFEAHGAAFQPDAVVIFPYENDLYWDGQPKYRRFPKPMYTSFGDTQHLVLTDPGPKPWFEHTALGTMWSAMKDPPQHWQFEEGRFLDKEYGAYFTTPPEFMVDAVGRTKGALTALKAACKKVGEEHGGKSLPLWVVPIPEKVAIEAEAKEQFAFALHPKTPHERLKFWQQGVPLDPSAWSADKPVDTFLGMARELNLPALDARAALREAAANDTHLYYETDWHLNPHGNHVFARFLHDQLDRAALFPPAFAAAKPADMAPEETPSKFPRWPFVYVGLWLVLSTLYAITYRDEPRWKAALGVAVMLGLVFTIAIGGGALIHMLPPAISTLVFVLVLTVILSFIVIKLGRRLTTIGELFTSFTRRGHWYLMPLVVVLLSIGSLLVVAASSPLIAPFIYTLF